MSVEPNAPKKASLVWLWVTIPVILLVTASIVVPIILFNQSSQRDGRVEDARRKATIALISNLKMALNSFEIDNGRYPTTQEGLHALLERPLGMGSDWRKYIDEVPLDKWGHPFQYQGPDTVGEGEFDIISAGGDGELGTADDIDKFTRD
jgi:general secretion pathway protein G